ncbi:uncharacterized protein MONOS_3029 [Monocercomonoides exilis]|uniref:uncharacterized protein n=1 Tax=Monocercomonoides exilis TaxID=2049356 RepID=UPI00355937AA|nr:hypothetical protein MONOS_3029 [Monocercomonoides exilis]|eukprot:MONOS_3029.1-p1 / transcript=MONOS_3029.1 / gene=MONOS_3029 / organism=Monocercomonoides_exilis_PA203 / gene_product=unspecified product / transcript_product=unspecified product / location=Mono_scaffold00067:69432-70470(+) / protein_length=153 / sequence_SO=supercontig / SO=protein_coding / is_pseudo=false
MSRALSFFETDLDIDQRFREDSTLILLNLLENLTLFPLNFFKGKRILDFSTGTGVCGIALSLIGFEFSDENFEHLSQFFLTAMNAKTVVIASYELRSKSDLEFFKKLNEILYIQKIPMQNVTETLRDEQIGLFFFKKKEQSPEQKSEVKKTK